MEALRFRAGVPEVGHSRACKVVRQAESIAAIYDQLSAFDHRTQQGLRRVTPEQLQYALTLTMLVASTRNDPWALYVR